MGSLHQGKTVFGRSPPIFLYDTELLEKALVGRKKQHQIFTGFKVFQRYEKLLLCGLYHLFGGGSIVV